MNKLLSLTITLITIILTIVLAYFLFREQTPPAKLPFGAGVMQFTTSAASLVPVNTNIKVSASLYDKAGSRKDSGNLVYVVAPKQASYSKNKGENGLKQATNGEYSIDYVATSTGIHTIEFWTVDPDSTKSRDIIISKVVTLIVE